MREILFRGKQTDNGTWTYGYLFCIWERTYLCWGTTNNVPNMKEVLPETVCQFTGIYDKNGMKIFEGDVIKRFWLGAEIIYCVRYDGQDAHFIGKAMNKSGFTTFDNDGEMFEVIGNIHDNPELLEDFNKEV